MNIKAKLDNTYITMSSTHRNEIEIDINTDKDGVKELLYGIYDVLNMDDFISTLDDDQKSEILEEMDDEIIHRFLEEQGVIFNKG